MIRLDPRRILIALLATDMALLSTFLLAEYGGWPMRLRALVDMNRDLSITAWWSAAQLLVAGLLAVGYGLLLRGRDASSHWKLFALGGVGLVLLSADEAAMIDESLSAALYNGLRHRFDLFEKPQRWDALTAGLYATAALAVLLAVRRDVWPALRERGTPAGVAGVLTFLAGAVFLDNLPLGAGTPLLYGLEDVLELAGASLIVFSMLRMLEGRVVVAIGAASATEAMGARRNSLP